MAVDYQVITEAEIGLLPTYHTIGEELLKSGLFRYNLDWLKEKLHAGGVVKRHEFEAVKEEFLRWMCVAASRPLGTYTPMFSEKVDAFWHELILYTEEYMAFCDGNFGRYIHHAPSPYPHVAEVKAMRQAKYGEFVQLYEAYFGELPTAVCWNAEDSKACCGGHHGDIRSSK